ncbi:MAG: diaminopimelate decarboxylase [Rickettsiales bacterium]|nr:diaminopimelate decarboxylase [Pseudomonadota bacterium]MDA0966120.1 diaminopimelate decarboxylase [Pseudomonadota bacterium]MDG4543215.1 diaminopimelate decarboxylase [Rickettsiales bacterium]MDG4545413.1 diaminopimelate decarboxylase [Rickettsiales bacterium]MDG4547862.1 diaminopimelate decarboxylase [Rickettsiales bacterium]
MDHFNYKNGELFAENVAIKEIAKKVGTPFYCYSTATLERHYNVFADALKDVNATICFAVKANSNLAVLKTLANLGAGGDCVSEGEIRRCLTAGIAADKIVFSGVGKTKSELVFALKNNVMQINVESEVELESLNEVASSLNVKAPVSFRVNPDIDAGTHDKISTGRKEDKFGISYEQAREIYSKAAKMEHIHIRGVATHIGSQLIELKPFKAAFAKIRSLVEDLRADGHNISHLDLGGGLGIPYKDQLPPSPDEYAKMVIEATDGLGCELAFEPGRLIAGNAGILVSEVIYLKKTAHRNFLVIDAAMNDLIRPTLYDAYHEIIPVDEKPNVLQMDIVGPICETGDVFGKERKLPELIAGDLIAIRSCGAYGAVMSSEYNSRLLIPEVMVNDDKFAVIREREDYEDMLKKDKLPNWL